MRLRAVIYAVLPLLLLLGAVGIWWGSTTVTPRQSVLLEPSPFDKWVPLIGKFQAANPVTLRADLDGLSKISWLIGDGTPVETGDLLARFDPYTLEEKKLTITRDLEVAKSEYQALVQAQHPLQLKRLETERSALISDIKEEESLRDEVQDLVDEMLLAEEELDRHTAKIAQLRSEIRFLEDQLEVTKTILHPALEKKASARLQAAETALKRIEERLEKTRVTSPTRGTVYLPQTHIDGEYRKLRIGDGLFRNQVLMEIADLTQLVIQTEIGEHQLSLVVPGLNAQVRLPAYPDRTLSATVTKVGSHPEGSQQKYPVTLRLIEPQEMLRPGLTAEIEILAFRLEQVIVVPREYLLYDQNQTKVRLENGQLQSVGVAEGNATSVVISEGLQFGDRLLKP